MISDTMRHVSPVSLAPPDVMDASEMEAFRKLYSPGHPAFVQDGDDKVQGDQQAFFNWEGVRGQWQGTFGNTEYYGDTQPSEEYCRAFETDDRLRQGFPPLDTDKRVRNTFNVRMQSPTGDKGRPPKRQRVPSTRVSAERWQDQILLGDDEEVMEASLAKEVERHAEVIGKAAREAAARADGDSGLATTRTCVEAKRIEIAYAELRGRRTCKCARSCDSADKRVYGFIGLHGDIYLKTAAGMPGESCGRCLV